MSRGFEKVSWIMAFYYVKLLAPQVLDFSVVEGALSLFSTRIFKTSIKACI